MKIRTIGVLLLLFFCLAVGSVHACGFCKKDGGRFSKSGVRFDAEDKFFLKAKMTLSMAQELGLSAEQVKAIKDLKRNMQKEALKTDADIEIISLDIEEQLSADVPEAEAIKAAVEKKFDLKKKKVQSLIDSYIALQGVFTKEQKEKLNELCDKRSQEGKKCPKAEGGHDCMLQDQK